MLRILSTILIREHKVVLSIWDNMVLKRRVEISLLRIWLGFSIVIGHFHDYDENIGWIFSKLLSVSGIVVPFLS